LGREHKTTIAIDRQAAREAQDELGTTTLVDTVNAALREVAARASRRRFIERLSQSKDIELGDPDVMRSAWR
jgi:Arc/MetJ family transcription regulator